MSLERRRRIALAVVVSIAGALLPGCGGKPRTPVAGPETTRPAGLPLAPATRPAPLDPLYDSFTNPAVDLLVRCQKVLSYADSATPDRARAIPALLRVMRHKSHAAFILYDDPDAGASPLGWRVDECPLDSTDETQGVLRVAAITALEAMRATVALPDLTLALEDKEGLVGVHAARALMTMGCRAGVPFVIAALEGKAYQNETANRFLMGWSGEDMKFNADSGWTAKTAAIARWKAWWERRSLDARPLIGEGAPCKMGDDDATDRRIRLHVQLLGRYQFVFHEQARRALQRIGAPAVPFIEQEIPASQTPDVPVWRGAMAQVLGAINTPDARRVLGALARDTSGAVRARAVEGWSKLGGADALAACRTAMTDRDTSVVIAGVRGLARCGAAADAGALDALKPRREPELVRAVDFSRVLLTRTEAAFDVAGAHLMSASVNARSEAVFNLGLLSPTVVLDDPDASEDARKAALATWRALLKK